MLKDMDNLLRMEKISKSFPGVKALDSVNIELKRGEVHAIAGENGAGKSTFMKVLTGIYKQDEGEIYYKGNLFLPENPKHAQEMGISIIHQELNLLPDLSVANNIYISREPRKVRGIIDDKEMNEKAMEILKVFDLDKEADTLAGNLPYGKQRKLEIARALATNPKLLLLDEPAAGMNPNETQELMDTIRFVQKHFDMTILLIEHDMKLVGGICEEVTVLNFGQVLAQGETLKVLKDPAVVTAYLGE